MTRPHSTQNSNPKCRGVQGSKGSENPCGVGGCVQEGWEEEWKGNVQKTVQESRHGRGVQVTGTTGKVGPAPCWIWVYLDTH